MIATLPESSAGSQRVVYIYAVLPAHLLSMPCHGIPARALIKKKIQRQHDCIATSIICIVEKRITSENNAASNEKNVTMLKQLLHSFYDTILPENMYSHPVEVQS